MAQMTLADLVRRNVIGAEGFGQFFGQLGGGEWRTAPGGMDAAGNPIFEAAPSADAAARAAGYSFDWNDTGTGNTGTLSAFDPTGALYGNYQQQDTSTAQSLGEFAALAAAGFGGLGLAGLGPAAGLFGGSAAGGAGITGSGSSAANLAAYGGTLTPAQVAATAGGLQLGGAGAGLGAAGLGAAGAAGAAGAGVAGAAGAAGTGGFWATALKTAAPLLGSALGGVISANAANKASDAQQAAAREAMKMLQPYMTAGAAGLSGQQALLGLSGNEAQQSAIQGIQDSPQFKAMQQLGENRILANASATGGLRGGNVQGALAQFSPQLLSQLIDQQYSRLGGLTSGGLAAAGGAGQQANQIGAAQAGGALASGSALGGVLNTGAGLLGQYFGGQVQSIPQQTNIQPQQTPFGNFSLGPF